MSQTGYVITYANCPIFWKSSLQTEIALSTAEAENIALLTALYQVLPLMTLMEELDKTIHLDITKAKFNCKVHKDNQSRITMALSAKFTSETKHIALKYHHFKWNFKQGRISISYISTNQQKANIFTKPLPDHNFFPLCYMLCGRT